MCASIIIIEAHTNNLAMYKSTFWDLKILQKKQLSTYTRVMNTESEISILLA